MDYKMASQDQRILRYVFENFSCKICNNILIQCVTLSCGHHFCNYCIEMLHAGMLHQCPQCSSPIHRTMPNNSVDQQIDNLIHSCSESIQKSYTSALNARFKKSLERSKTRCNEAISNSTHVGNNDGPKLADFFDQIRDTLQMNNINPQHSVTSSLKSARNHRNHGRFAPKNGISEQNTSARPRSKPLTVSGGQNSASKSSEVQNDGAQSEIDVNKVNLLFGIYDHVLTSDNERDAELASGDFVRNHDLQTAELPVLEGMTNFTKRSELELETLIKETDDIVRLDGHIQEWTNKMKDALCGNKETVGIETEIFDNKVHAVDDELWKASNELLKKLQGMQNDRKQSDKVRVSFSCPPTPLPRSYKVNFDTVSDDSDVEEYEHALETLQQCLDSSYDVSTQIPLTDLKQNEDTHNDTRRKIESESTQDGHCNYKMKPSNNSSEPRSARKKSILESMEESGQSYIKENIEFITKMRKYKEALMKIQNHEVVTAQEIKELVPNRIFPSSDAQDSTGLIKCGDATTPRRLSHISSQASRRNHSYSARLPMSTSVDRRPMTATYDIPSSKLIHKQIGVAPTKQYLKQRARARANNSLFTAR